MDDRQFELKESQYEVSPGICKDTQVEDGAS